MANPRTDFPPVRACIFDMDGLLLDTEDLLTTCHNTVLSQNDRSPLTWSIKAQLQGRPLKEAVTLLLNWANLTHITAEEYIKQLAVMQAQQFPLCAPLPGVSKLLQDLKATEEGGEKQRVYLALATSSATDIFRIKTQRWRELMAVFDEPRRVLGDDPRIAKGRGKPSPDIYLVALRAINESLAEGELELRPEECLVFEDSVPGIEAGRRAGMRVVWVPDPKLAELYKGREDLVLAGRGEESLKDEHELGVVGDGWGEQLRSLVDFPYEKYGIFTRK